MPNDQRGPYVVTLSVSDGTNTSLAAPINISVGHRPAASILAPFDGSLFRAGDTITFSGDGTEFDGGALPASAFTWNIDFLHEGHVHPGLPETGVKSGTFVIPTAGHDFSGNTRYRITLTVTDSDGLQSSQSVIVYPEKVTVSFDSVPSGLQIYVDGIPNVTPFTRDTLIGFNHTINAPNQARGNWRTPSADGPIPARSSTSISSLPHSIRWLRASRLRRTPCRLDSWPVTAFPRGAARSRRTFRGTTRPARSSAIRRGPLRASTETV
jgi:hypothetical protein